MLVELDILLIFCVVLTEEFLQFIILVPKILIVLNALLVLMIELFQKTESIAICINRLFILW